MRAMGPTLVAERPPALASARLRNHSRFSNSSRSLPLMLSTHPFLPRTAGRDEGRIDRSIPQPEHNLRCRRQTE